MKRLSWKYIAGFVDGEGCIDLQVRRYITPDGEERFYCRPRIRIAQIISGLGILENLKTNFSGNIYTKNRNCKNPNWQDAFYWTLEGKRLRPFLQNIVNHTIIKKEQIKLCIWMIDNVIGKHVEKEIRERLNDELRAMKRDSQRLSEVAVSEIMALMR